MILTTLYPFHTKKSPFWTDVTNIRLGYAGHEMGITSRKSQHNYYNTVSNIC